MRLVEHVRRIEAGEPLQLCIDELVEHQEQLERLHRPRIEVIVAELTVVEMKPAKLTELDETGDDLLDVRIRDVMPEIDQ